MPVILDAVELEQAERDLIAQNLEIGAFLGREPRVVPLIEACSKVNIELALGRDALGAEVIQRVIEADAFMVVVAGLGRTRRRKRQRAVNELFGQRIQPWGGG